MRILSKKVMHGAVWASMWWSSTISQTAFADSCDSKLPLLSLNLGIEHRDDESNPIRIKVVNSRYKWLADKINGVATYFFGDLIRLQDINQITQRFLSDPSKDHFFVKIVRAFRYSVQYDEAILASSIPATGPVIVTANHPRNGSDLISLAAAVAKVRPDTKIALTLFLENYPQLAEHAIFLNPYGGEAAKKYNEKKRIEMAEHLRAGGVLVMSASGEVSRKPPGSSELPVDRPWRLGTADLVGQVPSTQVVISYIGGEASPSFYKVAHWGIQILATIFHVRELANNIGQDFPVFFDRPISGQSLLDKFGTKLRDMMSYLRARTYLMADRTQNPPEMNFPRLLEEANPALVRQQLISQGQRLYTGRGMEAHWVREELTGALKVAVDSLRDKFFLDSDAIDASNFLVIRDSETGQIVTAAKLTFPSDWASNRRSLFGAFSADLLLNQVGPQSVALGPIYYDPRMSRLQIENAMQVMNEGINKIIHVSAGHSYILSVLKFPVGYSVTSQNLMAKYLSRTSSSPWSQLVKPRAPLSPSQFEPEIQVVSDQIQSLEELRRLVLTLDGLPLPPTIELFERLKARYLGFGRRTDESSIEGMVLVDLRP